MDDLRAALLLSVQRALLGAVSPDLRAVTCAWEETEIQIRFFFHGEVAESDSDDAHAVAAEVIADFPSPWTIAEEVVRMDHPADLQPHALRFWAYLRKETASAAEA